MTAAAWHPDPTGRHELRYWDGTQWTEHVSDRGVQSTAPLTPPEEPGTHGGDVPAEQQTGSSEPLRDTGDQPAQEMAPQEVPAHQQVEDHGPTSEAPPTEPPSYQPTPGEQAAQQPPAYAPDASSYGEQPSGAPVGGHQPSSGGQPSGAPSGAGGISGDLIGGRYAEVAAGPGPSLQNSRLLRVRVAEPFMARQGSMVAYQGNVSFAFQGGGAAKFLKKAFTGEGLSLMRVEGQGDVFLADAARHVHILQMTDSGISVNGSNVLAFSTSLDWNVERVRGGSMAAGGLFNTTLRGTGWVAITTDGDPVVLNPAEAPTFADTNAIVAWSVDLQTNVKSSVTAGSLIGRGSGEAFQVTFAGQGFVIVQPSEGAIVPPHTH